MEEKFGLIIVIVLVVSLGYGIYRIIKTVHDVVKYERLIDEHKILMEKYKKTFINKVKKIYPLINNSNWFNMTLKLIDAKMNVEYDFMANPKEVYLNYCEAYDELINLCDNIENDIKSTVKEIERSIDNWYSDKDLLPEFFVLECVGPYKTREELYCHSVNVHFKDFLTIIGNVYVHKSAYAKTMEIVPQNYFIREMDAEEFETIYIPERLKVMEFNDVRKEVEYVKYLRYQFYK